jgi:hypothetical protein
MESARPSIAVLRADIADRQERAISGLMRVTSAGNLSDQAAASCRCWFPWNLVQIGSPLLARGALQGARRKFKLRCQKVGSLSGTAFRPGYLAEVIESNLPVLGKHRPHEKRMVV